MIFRSLERYLCPDEAPQGIAAILRILQNAKTQIRIFAYGFTLPAIVDILIAKHQAGVDVELLLDYSQASGPTELAQVRRLYAAGVPFLVGTSPEHAIRHSKIIIVDGEWIEDGSYNYGANAGHQNNTIVVQRDKEIAGDGLANYADNRAFLLAKEAGTQAAYLLKCQAPDAVPSPPVPAQAIVVQGATS